MYYLIQSYKDKDMHMKITHRRINTVNEDHS
jgi:hypothetical protein